MRLYFHYVSINIRCTMQYKASFLLTAIGQFLVSFTIFLGIFFMFQRFSKGFYLQRSAVMFCNHADGIFSCRNVRQRVRPVLRLGKDRGVRPYTGSSPE